ncbi:MAG: trypsin-like peptidase domain-containing protein [Pirellulales bacterium]
MSLVTGQTTGVRTEFAPAPTGGSPTTPSPRLHPWAVGPSRVRRAWLLVPLVVLALLPSLATAANLQVVEFTSASCAACRQVQPVIEQFLAKGYPITQVDADKQAELANRFQVTKLPTFVVLRDNQEIGRREGALSVEEILALFQPPTLQQAPLQQAPSLETKSAILEAPESWSQTATPSAVGPLAPHSSAAAPFAAGPSAAPASATPQPDVPAGSPWNAATPRADSMVPGAANPNVGPQQLALQASVRIRVEDAEGVSYGSGTVIDVHGAEALVVTCGHVFRDSQGKGRILIDTSDGQQVGVAAHLVSYDLTRDVGLISFHSNRTIQPVIVGGPQHRLQAGDPVFSIGCDKGDAPSVRKGQVVALNKYLGPANITVTGQPIDGRSGGGLFDAEGVLVGICNCADPQANEGLYAALPSVHAELDRSRLAFIYRRSNQSQPGNMLAAPNTLDPAAVSSISAAAGNRSAGPGTIPFNPSTPLAATTLAAGEGEANEDVELILIVRSKQNPHTDSKMFVVAEPSTVMLEQVQREVVRQSNARTTSWQQQR